MDVTDIHAGSVMTIQEKPMSRWNPDDIASARSNCDVCERDYINYMREQWLIDKLAKRDPEPPGKRRAEFDAWVLTDPEPPNGDTNESV